MPTADMTVKQLYQLCTGDCASHQRRIDAHFRRLDERRQRIVRARVAGRSLRQLAEEEGLSHGTLQKMIRRSMEAIRKAIAGEPRYNRAGRKKAAAA